ncbi:signal peptidase II [Geminicoccaceae bacterium 1502E]|nr:signal peptidase II [Geminicoccaceae bacterium 1502E]
MTVSTGRALALFLAVLLLDQLTKQAALTYVDPLQAIAVTPFFNLVLVGNRGISFGLFSTGSLAGSWFLVVMTLAIGVALLLWYRREPRSLPRFALVLVLGGAVGNLIDRLRFGAVVDFLDFHLQGYHWPAFNVADCAIVVGAALLMVDGLFVSRATPQQGEER